MSATADVTQPDVDPTARLRVPVRVYLAEGTFTRSELLETFDEVNRIWAQASICFEFEAVHHMAPPADGLAIVLRGVTGPANGATWNDWQAWVARVPALEDVDHPARHPSARTMAHELGHALGLGHTNVGEWGVDRRENLMASGTLGWQLPSGPEVPIDQVTQARVEALQVARAGGPGVPCHAPRLPVQLAKESEPEVAAWLGAPTRRIELEPPPAEGGDGPPVPDEPAEDCASWTHQGGSALEDMANGLTRSHRGGVFVVGSVAGRPGEALILGRRTAIVRRLARGAGPDWTRTVASRGHDLAADVASDYEGAAVVVGSTSGGLHRGGRHGAGDGFVARFTADGDQQWVRQFGSRRNDHFRAVTLGTQGQIYAVGQTFGELVPGGRAGGWDAVVLALTREGEVEWARQFGGTGPDRATRVALSAEEVILVAGSTATVTGAQGARGRDVFVTALDRAGEVQWSTHLGTATDDDLVGLEVDEDGGLRLAIATGVGRLVLVRLEPDGSIAWQRHEHFGPRTRPTAFVRTGDRLVVAGWTADDLAGAPPLGGLDAFVATYDLDGRRRRVQTFGTDADDLVRDLTSDGVEAVLVAGATSGRLGTTALGQEDLFVHRVCVE